MITRGQIRAMFAGYSTGVDRFDGSLSFSALPHQRLRVVVRHRDPVVRERKAPTKRVHAAGRGKAQYAAIKADTRRWAAKKAQHNAYRAAVRVRDPLKARGHNTRKLSSEAIADIKASSLSVSALARKHGVSRRTIDAHR